MTSKILWVPFVFICMVSCTPKKENAPQKVIIRTEKAMQFSEKDHEEYSFISRPYRTSELSFRVSGPINRFDVYAGNYYKKGSIIAEIDPRDFRLCKERTEAVYKQMTAEFERIQKLYDKKNISASSYEKTRADYITAKTAFYTASNELTDSRLTAPFSGYVGEVYIDKYQDVKASQPVLSLIDIDQLKIEIYVTQDVAMTAQSIGTVDVRFDTAPNQIYKAQVAEVSKGTTRNNLSYLLTALLPNPNGKLIAGMSGKAWLTLPKNNVITGSVISQSALCHRPTEGDFVWVVNKEKKIVSQRVIRKGDLLPDGKIVIVDGLAPDETIATSSLRFLSDGMKVELSSKKD